MYAGISGNTLGGTVCRHVGICVIFVIYDFVVMRPL